MTSSRYDLVIVGGGIVGACSAYMTAISHPGWRILVLDRQLIGDGNATAYSAALAPHFGRSPDQLEMSARSLQLYREWHQRLNLPLRDIDVVWITSPESAGRIPDMLGGEILPADELLAAHPYVVLPPNWTAFRTRALQSPDPSQLTARLLHWTRKRAGLEVWDGVQAVDLHDEGELCQLSLADGRRLSASKVIVATGPWGLSGPGQEAVRAAGIRRKKIVALHVQAPPPRDAPVFVFFDDEAFLLPWADSSMWLLSITSTEWDCDVDASKLFISSSERAHGRAILAGFAPSLRDACVAGRVFSDTYSPTGVPCISGLRGRWATANGGSGAGFRLAPEIARAALNWITS
ncbi:MAG: FAD-binding oxidoreductase [Proteobacteria bacterium]|nr:FAD-binding oxidoreductase [Pseudomonadota bacterium]